MKRTAFLALAVLVASGAGWADFQLGDNITVADGESTSGGYFGSDPLPWYTDAGVGGEDHEVEPGCVGGQAWDLEGFFMSGQTLQLVGGYDFQNGYYYGGQWLDPGDLFIDIGGTGGVMGYEYAVSWRYGVISGSPSPATAVVYSLGSSTTLLSVTEPINVPESNPWRIGSGATAETAEPYLNTVTYTAGVATEPVLLPDTASHNVVEFDLAWLYTLLGANEEDTQVNFHYTYECGNDFVRGTVLVPGTPGTPVPEPASITLMGLGIALVAVARMRKAA